MEPKVIFEDDNILVIDKPSGMIVNRADTTRGEETVQDWVEKQILSDEDIKILREQKLNAPSILVSQYPNISDFVRRAGIVHRLDKETSGILLIAKTPQAFENLQRQFKERTVKKKYITLVHGKVEPSEGEINVPVGRLPWNRERFGVIPGGRESVTGYKVIHVYGRHSGKSASWRAHPESRILKPFNGIQGKRVQDDSGDSGQARMTDSYSLLELHPQTGRTHQIRVHLKYMGHPIVADPLYGGRKQAREDRKWCKRLFLHASEISFQHPKTGEEVTFHSDFPEDLSNALKKLEVKS